MRKISILMSAAALVLSAASCLKEDEKSVPSGNDGQVFTARIAGGLDTKTVLTSENKVNWEEADSISINGVVYVAAPGSDATTAIFSKNDSKEHPSSPFYAFYPVGIQTGAAAEGVLPAEQKYEAGKITNVPMFAESTSNDLSFKNICAVLAITVKSADFPTVKSIRVSSSNKALSGAFTVANGKAFLKDSLNVDNTVTLTAETAVETAEDSVFYISIPAQTYQDLTIDLSADGSKYTKTLQTKSGVEIPVDVNTVYSITQAFKEHDWFYFEAVEAGAKVALVIPSKKGANPPKKLSLLYSTDGGESWTDYKIADTIPAGGLTAGQRIYFKAGTTEYKTKTNTAFGAAGSYDFYNFTATDSIKVGGNIMYLLNGSNPAAATLSSYCFKGLFKENSFIVSASDLKLPANELSDNCYRFMFISCKNLKTAPALPATELADTCYYQMFTACHALKAAPALPATKLATACYNSMFSGCIALVSAPVLPATELASTCYNQMFDNCSALVTAPALKATTLAAKCYFKMFCDCSALENPPALPATELADSCYCKMFLNCSTLVTAPVLPAKVLKRKCYLGIFSRCAKLNSVTMLATDISAENCLDQWLGQKAAGEEPAGSQTTGWKVFVAPGKVDDVKATVPDDPDWKSGVQEII